MLNTVYFLSDNYDHFKLNERCNSFNNFNLSFLTDCYNEQKLKEDYNFFSKNITQKFSLSFKVDQPLSLIFERAILAFFFIPAYGHTQKIINIICEDDLLFQTVTSTLKLAAKKQGIKDLRINLLAPSLKVYNNDLNSTPATNLLFKENNTFLETYQRAIDNFQFNQNIFCMLNGEVSPSLLTISLEKIEKNFQESNVDLYQTLLVKQNLLVENILLKKKILLLYNELDNYKEHNKILRSTHGAVELQQYYDKEYELLPRWFKHCGQLLKVLMGKRTLRSLFNNDVKKYKD